MQSDGKHSGEEQYSIRQTAGGERITVIDQKQDVFQGKPVQSYSAISRKLLLEHFSGQVLPLGEADLARLKKKQAGEYAYPRTQYAKTSLEYEAKMRAAAELDNLLETARSEEHTSELQSQGWSK